MEISDRIINHRPLLNRANLSGHLSAFGTGYIPRGNLTQKAWWLDYEGGRWISIFQWFDVAGNVVEFIDGKGYHIQYDFTDCFGAPDYEARSNTSPTALNGLSGYAYPTKVTNAKGHVTYRQYDFYTGQPVNAEDANSVISSMEYNDSLDRLTRHIRGYTNSGLTNSSNIFWRFRV